MNAPRQWIRLYTNVLDSPKVQRLPDSLYRFWTSCLLLCGLRGGYLPIVSDCAFRLRISERQVIARLQSLREAGLMEETPDGWTMHEWSDYQYDSDTSYERVKRFRKRHRNGDVTPSEQSRTDTETETEQNTPLPSLEKPPQPPKAKVQTLHPFGLVFDELYNELQVTYGSWAPHYVKADFLGQAWHEWSILDPSQKLVAIAGIKARADRGDDPAFAPNPTKYLRGRESEWNRPPRPQPQPKVSAMQQRINNL